jgi:hypothetical protein
MPASLPYLASNKNLPLLFDRIASAKIPDKFTHGFLTATLGLKGTNDRALIPLIRNMGFIDQSGNPTLMYRQLKGHNRAAVIAHGMRSAYAPLFDSDQYAEKLSAERLKSLIAQVAGVDADSTSRIASTFSSLSKLADFEATFETDSPGAKPETIISQEPADASRSERNNLKNLRTEFHYNLQIHLPTNGNEETYLNIFNAIRKTFQ